MDNDANTSKPIAVESVPKMQTIEDVKTYLQTRAESANELIA